MQVATERLANSQVALTIEVDPATVERGREQAYRRLVHRVNIPGFRRGKAPRPVVERHLEQGALLREALAVLIPDLYRQALQETSLKPLANPEWEIIQTEPLTLKAILDVEPMVELGDYRQIRLPRDEAQVSEEEVDAALSHLRRQHTEQTPVDRPARWGDALTISVIGRVGTRTGLDHREAEYELAADNPNPVAGFAQQLVGLRAGEKKEFGLLFPADYPEPELAGQEVAFAAQIHAVKEQRIPPLDDELARTTGEYDTLTELREGLREKLRHQAEARAAAQYEETVLVAVVEQARVEIPPRLIEEELDRVVQRLAAQMRAQSPNPALALSALQRSQAELRAQWRPDAQKLVKTRLVLDAVAEAENIVVPPEAVDHEITRLVQPSGDRAAQGRELALKPEAREEVLRTLRRRQARQLLVAIASGQAEETSTAPAAETEG